MILYIIRAGWYGVFPLVGLAAVIAGVLWAFSRLVVKGEAASDGLFALLFGLALLGTVLGFSAGNSRAPVIAALLSVLLSLMTMMLGYLFQRDRSAVNKGAIPLLILAILLPALHGTIVGSMNRQENEIHEQQEAFRLDLLMKHCERLVDSGAMWTSVPDECHYPLSGYLEDDESDGVGNTTEEQES